jgi:predicted lipase
MISVTFRGSAIFNDWVENIQIIQKEVENPSDKTGEKIGLHYGFYNILQRERKDSRKKEDGSAGTKVNRIIEKIMTRIKENSSPGEEWTLCTTGHSLGGALCTMFGFYAAADKRVQENVKLPVQVFSFASPKCGDFRFRKAFKLLEQEGKLVHARFCVAEDFGKLVPSSCFELDGSKSYSKCTCRSL